MSLNDLARRIEALTNTKIKVGAFKGKVYPDGTLLAEVVVTHEFGDMSKKIPSRPFMRPALKDSKSLMAGEAVKQLLDGKEAQQIGDFLGAYLVGGMQKKIRDLHTPVLRPLTIQKRLERGVTSIKPLIDSGYMQASLTFNVETSND